MSSTPKELNFNGRFDVVIRSMLSPTEGGRTENQDNYLVIDIDGNARFLDNQIEQQQRLDGWPRGHCRFAILDGMGGHSYGREATELTVEGLLKIQATNDLAELSGQLDDLHLKLHRLMRRSGAEPGCTLTLLEVPPPEQGPALLFHAGDSRLYQIDAAAAKCLTIDHVPATKFALFGLINAEEWYRQAHQASGFQISQAFVLGNSLGTRDLFGEVLENALFELNDRNLPKFLQGLGDRRPLPLDPGYTYLLASDGLWHLSKPLAFINRWPALLAPPNSNNDASVLAERLDTLFKELVKATEREPRLRGDNSTAIAIRPH